jgi:UDP-N-acetylglucosamine enolpyruvyl transferase
LIGWPHDIPYPEEIPLTDESNLSGAQHRAPPIQYIVEGGRRLSGTIEPSGNKNAALPIIAAALLTEHPVTLENVPRIRDTETLVELIRSVGASAEWRSRNTLAIHAKEIRAADLDPDLCARIRASILLAGPLLARCGEVALPPPGGDVIGRRRLDTHMLALEQLGATVTATHRLEFRAPRLKGADVFLDEPSVTATENALVAAVAAHGTTYLRNVASEPHVQDLAHFLVALGARIEGIGTNTMVVHGAAPLGQAHYAIGPDHIEVGSLIGLAAVVTASQCDGIILMFEKMFESRMFFVDKLISMGARIVLCDPHRAVVAGPSRLRGASMISPDIRAGMAMLLAAVCAEGTSTINNADQIERGYERIDERLNLLGASIKRVPERALG